MNTAHERITNGKDEWLTPPHIVHSLGDFDLDPCSPIIRPWETAKNYFTIEDDGLSQEWFGRIWLNPPYGREMIKFMKKMTEYRQGIACLFARTDTDAFQDYIFPFANSIFFIDKRLKFCHVNGEAAKTNSGAPSVLIAYDEYDSEKIEESGIKGFHCPVKEKMTFVVISKDENRTWRIVVGEALEELNKESNLSDIYNTVIKMAPKKIARNDNYKAKIRQVLQMHYTKINRGKYTC
jgi:hypothetical protein